MRLNVGCGDDVRDGWVNIDRDARPSFGDDYVTGRALHRGVRVIDVSIPIVVDVLDGLPFDDDTFEGAVAHHVLQMVEHSQLVPWLAEVRRVLKPGARLRITVPDLLGAVRAWTDDAIGWFPIDDEHESTIDGKLCLYVTQGGASRSVFTADWLVILCMRAGFGRTDHPNLRGVTYGHSWMTDLDSRLDESIVVEARK